MDFHTAFLVSGLISIQLGGAFESFNLGQLWTDTPSDIYVVAGSKSSSFQAAVKTTFWLRDICQLEALSFLCDIFEDVALSGGATMYASTERGVGILVHAAGLWNIIGSDNPFVTWILELLGWPEQGMEFSIEVGVEIDRNMIVTPTIKPTLEGKFEGVTFSTCAGENQCDEDSFCLPILEICLPSAILSQDLYLGIGEAGIELLGQFLDGTCGNVLDEVEGKLLGFFQEIMDGPACGKEYASTTITFDNFEESQWGSFATTSGKNANLVEKNELQGSWAVRLVGEADFYHTSKHTVASFSDLQLSFEMKARYLQNGEGFSVEYLSNVGDWVVLKRFAESVDFVNGETKQMAITSFRNPPYNVDVKSMNETQIRFRGDDGNNQADLIYFDNILFEGKIVKSLQIDFDFVNMTVPFEFGDDNILVLIQEIIKDIFKYTRIDAAESEGLIRGVIQPRKVCSQTNTLELATLGKSNNVSSCEMLGSGKYAIAAEIDKGDYLAFGVETKKVRSKGSKGPFAYACQVFLSLICVIYFK